jgi:hypothetical protein
VTRLERSAIRLMVAVAAALVLTVPSLQLLGGTMNASAYSDISMELDYPRYAGVTETFVCTLTVAGGPAGDRGGNFSYRAQVVGDETAGSSVTPETQTSADHVFKFNVTMPSVAPQTVKLRVNVTSTAADATASTFKVRDFDIKVVEPIVISATVYNIGDADVKDATARFYADGTLLATKTFSVAKGSSTTLRHNWTFVKIDEGKHVVTIVIDESEDLVEFRDGNNVYTLTIYVGERSNPIGAVLTIGVVIMSVLVALTVLQKPSRRKSP